MPRYPKQPLEAKLAWMRERQRVREDEARRKEEDELMARLMALSEEKAAWVREQMRRDAALGLAPTERKKMRRIDEVAKELGVSTMTVRRWFADRAIIVKPGLRRTTMLIPQTALDDWYAEHEPANSR